MNGRRAWGAITMIVLLGGCSSSRNEQAADSAPPVGGQITTTTLGRDESASSATPTTQHATDDSTSTPATPATDATDPTDAPTATTTSAGSTTPTAAPTTTAAPTPLPTTTAAPTTRPTTTPPTTTLATTTLPTQPTSTPYGLPVADGAHAGYSREHHDYPASDVFVPGGCGSQIISPVNGVVLESRREDGWVAGVDNPATRGGKSVAILGDDGVRYYLAHFDSIADDIEPGVRIEIGHALGLMGRTGRAGACHVHFAISPPCPGKEWAVRRGVIWPWGYLDAWRRGEQLSPVAEIEQWVADHPNACADAMADPNAADS